jgi:3-oxoacyl-[acyl-carrier protein] reductase
MAFDLSSRRAVVCGGSRGIGRSIALGLAQAGAAVSICARGAETLEATRGEIAEFGHAAHGGICDLADGAAVRRYIADAAQTLGGIDILVNNASGFGSSDDEAGWAVSVAVDMMAICTRRMLRCPSSSRPKAMW